MNKTFKILYIIFIFLLLLSSYKIISFSFETEEDENYEISSLLSSLEASATVNKEPIISSSHVIAIDRESLRVLFSKNAYDKTPMASTTKILTSIIAIEECSLDEIVNISAKAANCSGSTLGIYKNTKMTMKDLLYGLMLRSGNDCAVAIAEHISGDLENFAKLMNEKASKIGLTSSNFITPHGLDAPEHYTTAYELAILTNYALNNKTFLEIVGTKTTTVLCGNTYKTISNTNELLGNYTGVYGVKTGFTFGAGRCLVTACKQNNLDIIVVVLGANTKKIRTLDSIKILNYVFQNYSKHNIENLIYKSFSDFEKYYKDNLILEKTTDTCSLELSNIEKTSFPLLVNEISNLNIEIYTLNKLTAPLSQNTKLGVLSVKVNDEILLNLDIMLKNSIQKKTWQTYYLEILKNFFVF